MVNYQKERERERVKLTNTQLGKLKSAPKNRKGAILRLYMKNFEDEDLPHELFVTTRQSIKINRNTVANNTSADVKLDKDQILRFYQGSVTVL